MTETPHQAEAGLIHGQATDWLNHSPVPSHKGTIVIAGVARGGTTLIASLVYGLGVAMPGTRDRGVFESLKINSLLREGDSEGLLAFANKADEDHDVWAFKSPSILATSNQHAHCRNLRNPRFIIIFKDQFAVAKRRQISGGNTDLVGMLRRVSRQYANVADFVANSPSQMLLVSYEKAVTAREALVRDVADFCQVRVSPDGIDSLVAQMDPNKLDYIARSVRKGL